MRSSKFNPDKNFNENETAKELGKRHIKIISMFDDDHCFSTEDVTMGGKPVRYNSYEGTVFEKARVTSGPTTPDNRKFFKEAGCHQIDDLFCPYCGSPAWSTDQDGVASCESAPGWYFFYKNLEDSQKQEFEMRILNGQLTKVAKVRMEGGFKNG